MNYKLKIHKVLLATVALCNIIFWMDLIGSEPLVADLHLPKPQKILVGTIHETIDIYDARFAFFVTGKLKFSTKPQLMPKMEGIKLSGGALLEYEVYNLPVFIEQWDSSSTSIFKTYESSKAAIDLLRKIAETGEEVAIHVYQLKIQYGADGDLFAIIGDRFLIVSEKDQKKVSVQANTQN